MLLQVSCPLWVKIWVMVWKRPVQVKISDFILSGGTLKFDNNLEKHLDISPTLLQALCSISKPSVNSNWSHNLETPHLGKNQQFFVSCDLEIWWMTLKKTRHLSYAASSLVHHFIAIGELKLELQSGNTQFRSQSAIFLSSETLKFDGWPWKTIGHIF